MYVGMGKSKGLEFTKSFNPFSGKGLKKSLRSFAAVWGHLGVPSCHWWRAQLKAAFAFFLTWTVYFSNLGFLFCCPIQPYQPFLSLNLAFSSQEQSCSCLCRSRCVPSPVQPCRSMSVSLWGLKLFPTHCCWLSLSPPWCRTLLSICPCPRPCWSLSLVLFLEFHAVPVGLGAECLCSPHFILTAVSTSNQTAILACDLETGAGYIPLP